MPLRSACANAARSTTDPRELFIRCAPACLGSQRKFGNTWKIHNNEEPPFKTVLRSASSVLANALLMSAWHTCSVGVSINRCKPRMPKLTLKHGHSIDMYQVLQSIDGRCAWVASEPQGIT